MSQSASQSAIETPRTVVITGGRIIDPKNNIDQVGDVTVVDGKIAAVGQRPESAHGDDVTVIDATGKLVLPGLVDFHCHIFYGFGSYAVHPDRAGYRAGVTRANDVGSTGWLNVEGFVHHLARPATTRVSCFPNVVGLGMPENWAGVLTLSPGETTMPDQLIAMSRMHPETIRGVKVHMEVGMMAMQAEAGWKGFNTARAVTDAMGVNMYVHMGGLVPTASDYYFDPEKVPLLLVERMRPDEVLGHCFTPHPNGMVDDDGRVHPAAFAAHEKGVLHEVGHGINVSYKRARQFLDAGLKPDIISSDMHGYAHCGLVKDDILFTDYNSGIVAWTLAGTMSKCWALGMDLSDVVAGATCTPARVIGVGDQEGHLGVGTVADITIMCVESGDFTMNDSTGDKLKVKRRLLPSHTLIDGQVFTLDLSQLPEFDREIDPELKGMRPVVDK